VSWQRWCPINHRIESGVESQQTCQGEADKTCNMQEELRLTFGKANGVLGGNGLSIGVESTCTTVGDEKQVRPT